MLVKLQEGSEQVVEDPPQKLTALQANAMQARAISINIAALIISTWITNSTAINVGFVLVTDRIRTCCGD